MSVVFFGTADFAVPCLEALIENGHHVLAVVTQPDKPQGRGLQMSVSPVKKAALRHGIPVLQPRRVKADAFVAKIKSMSPDILVIAAFGQLIPQALLDIPPFGPINVHGSLLPKYRGAAPIQRALMAGEQLTGVTTMWMDATLDTGDMLLKEAIPISPDDTTGTLFDKLALVGSRLLIETIDQLAAGTAVRMPQDGSEATQAPMIKPDDAIIDWKQPASASVNRIRGLTPRPGAFANMRGKRIKIWAAMAEDTVSANPVTVVPGTVIGLSKSPAGIRVACGEGTSLLISEVQPDGGKRMLADAWARGLRLQVGDTFDLPPVITENN